MKLILSLLISLLTAATTYAQDAKTIDGIFITVSNSETFYKLEDMPKIVLGGRLIILKDGKWYDASGKQIQK